MPNRIRDNLVVAVGVIGAIVVLIPTLSLIGLILWTTTLPSRLGRRFDSTEVARRIVESIATPAEMRRIREDFLLIVMSEMEMDNSLDRWGLLREIDRSRSEIRRQLKDGEFAITLIGSIGAVLLGNILGLTVGSLVLTVTALFFSFLVAIRVVVIDYLAFESIPNCDKPLRTLAAMRAWNYGPIFGSGAVGTAILSIFASKSKIGYRTGMWFIESVALASYDRTEDEWYVDE